jgi:1-acyl-sn-glycerol-3-phosphate acyltransferase
MNRAAQGDLRPEINDFHGVISVLLWIYVVLFGLICTGLALALVLVGAPAWDRRRRTFQTLAMLWGRGLCRTLPFRVELRGAETVGSGPYVITSNHQSVVDLLVLYKLPLWYRSVIKRSWFFTPFGFAIWLAGYLSTRRSSNSTTAARLLERCMGALREGTSLLMFPEGTRSHRWRLLRFRRGPFELALRAGAAVLPVAVAGTNDVAHPSSWRFSLKKVIIVEVLPAICPRDFAGDSRLVRDRCRELVEKRVEALRDELWRRLGQGPAAPH